MCDVLPTLVENIPGEEDSDVEAGGRGDVSGFEQLMMNMLEERDKLMENLREAQDNLAAASRKLKEAEAERNVLLSHLQKAMPEVGLELLLG